MRHEVKTEIDVHEKDNKIVKLLHYSTPNLSSEFWRVDIQKEGKFGMSQSIPFNSETLARAVFSSHVNF